MKKLKIEKKNKRFLFLSCFFIFLALVLLYISSSKWNKQTDYRNIAHLFTSITFERWDSDGPQYFYFAPVISYDNPGDKFVDIYPRVFDRQGNNYYLSHPSGSFLLSFSLCQLFDLPVNNLSLQKILFIYFIFSVIGIMLLLSLLFHNNISIIVGTLVYAFHPLILYSFTFYHFAETIGLVFFIWLLVFHLLINKFPNNKFYLLLHKLWLLCYLLIDWMALIYSIFYILYSIRKKNNNEALLVISLTIIAYLMIIIQYSSIAGLHPFINSIWMRYIDRVGIFYNIFHSDGFFAVFKEFLLLLSRSLWNALQGTGILLVLMILPIISKSKIFNNDANWQFIIKWVLMPILIFSIIVFSAVLTHYVYMAKFVLFISLAISFVFNKYILQKNKKWIYASYILIFIMTILWSLHLYSGFYKYDSLQDSLNQQANILKNNAKPTDKCIYILSDGQNVNELVYICYISKRNMLFFTDTEEFNKWYSNNANEECYYIINNF
jgi:hypothetical protein